MSKLRDYVWLFLVGCAIIFLFRSWFSGGVISGSDFTYVYPSQFKEFTLQPYAWSGIFGNGLGGLTLNILNLDFYLHGIGGLLVNQFHLSWGAANRLIFFWPFLFVGFFGAYYLGLTTVKNKIFASVSPLIYLTNTYILMLVGGGQVGLMMAYAVAPFVLASFINNNQLVFFVSSACLVLFDLRFSVLIFGAVILYTLIGIPVKNWAAKVRFLVPPMIGVLAVHSFWLIPAVFSKSLVVPEGYDDPNWLSFLSWADFPKTLSFLHPNWPENVFGKTYFMRPEFLILPLAAFIPLLYTRIKKSLDASHYYFFAVLLLVGAFLAKGVHPPFGYMYEWMFTHLPLFSGYRDPTKFYLLISVSYTVLIPYFLYRSRMMTQKRVNNHIVMLAVIAIWGVLISPFVTGSLGGAFKKAVIPSEYEQYEQLAAGSREFHRTLVVPWRNRFVYNSTLFPAMDISAIFKTRDIGIINMMLHSPEVERMLSRYAVKYVVVPQDSTSEIFLKDRTYDPAMRDSVISALDDLRFLKKRPDFHNLTVYEYSNPRFHLSFETGVNNYTAIPSLQENPGVYAMRFPAKEHAETLIFSEQFDPRWQLWDGDHLLTTKKTADGLNSFIIPPGTTRTAEVFFSLQRQIYRWQQVSLAGVIIIIIVLLCMLWKKSKDNARIQRVLGIVYSVGAWGVIICLFMSMQRSTNPHIFWSRDWAVIQNPTDGRILHRSSYEGSEVKFRVYGASYIDLEVSGIDPEYASTFDIRVNDRPYVSSLPLGNPIDHMRIPGLFSGFEIDIKTVCSGSPSCSLTVRDIRVPFGGVIVGSGVVHKRSIAILGDSISGMHGIHGYGYKVADTMGLQFHNASVIGGTMSSKNGYIPGVTRFKKDILSYKPNTVIIALGANDILRDVSVEDFGADYRKVVQTIQTESSGTNIILLGLFHQDSVNDKKVEQYNKKIQEISRAFGVPYIDTFSLVPKKLFQDTLHPGLDAQDMLVDAIKTAMGGKTE